MRYISIALVVLAALSVSAACGDRGGPLLDTTGPTPIPSPPSPNPIPPVPPPNPVPPTPGLTVASLDFRTDTDVCEPGQSVQAEAKATYTDGTVRDVTTEVNWISENEAVATVSKTGLIGCVAVGTTFIRGQFGGQGRRMDITVRLRGPDMVSLEPRTNTNVCEPGQSVQAEAKATYTDGTVRDVTTEVNWISENEAVATVSKTGLIGCVAVGTTFIRAELGGQRRRMDITVFDSSKPSIIIREVLPASPAGPLPRGDFNTVRLLIHYEQNNWPGADRLTAWACEADDRPGMFIRTSCQANSVSKSAPDLYLNPTLGIRGTSDCGITKVARLVVFLTPTNEEPHTPSPTDPYKSESGLTIWARAERAVNWTYQPCAN